MKETIVLYPSPGISHLVSMVELGRSIVKHFPSSFAVAIIITPVLYETGKTSLYVSAVSKTTPSITFHTLPTIPPPPVADPMSPFNIPYLNFEYPRVQNPNLRELLGLIAQPPGNGPIKACVIDWFCSASIDVLKELSIPTYYFFSNTALAANLFLCAPMLYKKMESLTEEEKYNAVFYDVCSIPLRYSDLSRSMFNSKSPTYKLYKQTCKLMLDCSGILVNSFELFEEKAIKTIKEGRCVPGGRTPPIYPIGPLLRSTNDVDDEGRHDCLSWLDSQPNRSVLFLCFGSLGVFSIEQLEEIANGLEKSGVKFLWVLRIPSSHKKNMSAESELSVNSVLPTGFTERTRDRGFVLQDWVPQMAVLGHDSVGGFVTHCGGSSLRESVCFGVPMITWPLYAEQAMNCVYLVEELKIGLKVNMSDTGYVTAAELEERVRELMESERGEMIRDRVTMFRDAAAFAMGDDGSSRAELSRWIHDVLNK